MSGMDMFDEIEDLSSVRFSRYNEEDSYQETRESTGISIANESSNSMLGFDFDINALAGLNVDVENNEPSQLGVPSNQLHTLEEDDVDVDEAENSEKLQESQKQSGFKIPDLSILSKIKRRLVGEEEQQTSVVMELADTQIIPDLDFSSSILSKETQEVQRLPQLQIDLSDFESSEAQETQRVSAHKLPETQKIQQTQILQETQQLQQSEVSPQYSNSLFVDNDEVDEFVPSAPLTAQQRQERIAKLAEKKKQQRLADQQKELENEISRTSLTDDEEDLNDINDSVVSNINTTQSRGVSAKEIEESEMFLNEQRRQRDLRPAFQKKTNFSKSMLLNAFDESDEEQPQRASSSPIGLKSNNPKSSPITSPVQLHIKPAEDKEGSDSDDDINVLELIKQPTIQAAASTQTRNPIEIYAQKLKAQLASSPIRSTDNEDGAQSTRQKLVDLDDSDSDIDVHSSPLRRMNGKPAHISKPGFEKIPELSKEQKLTIKQKFCKKKIMSSGHITKSFMIKGLQNQNNIAKESKEFLANLSRVNVHQLKINKLNNPENAIIEEMEKEEEIMGSLLEREMERARNIRKKEKFKERAKLALLGRLANEEEDGEFIQSAADAGEIPESDYESVPDSDSGSDSERESSQSDEDDNDVNESDNDINVEVKRKSKLVISDDEQEEEELTQTMTELQRSDDSYMFGNRDEGENEDSLGIDCDQLITTVTSQQIKKVFGTGASLTQAFDAGSPVSNEIDNNVPFADNQSTIDQIEEQNEQFITARSDEYQLFQNLQPRTADSQTSQLSDMNVSFVHTKKIPSFRDISEFNTQESTPPDSTQVDYPTGMNMETQLLPSEKETDDDDDDDITPFSVRRGRNKMIEMSNTQDADAIDDGDKESTEEDKENIKAQIKIYEDKIRRKELKMRKKRKELEKKGIQNMVDGEAEESEDEWKGIGGLDGEVSDQANSEDERMIDNNLFIDLKNDEIRNKFMQEYQIKDQKELEKLLDDIKNHRFSKRAAANDLDIELSDEDDELLLAYRRQKLKEQQERLLQNKKIQALSKDEKAKAFFASIQDVDSVIKIDDDEDEDEDDLSAQQSTSASLKNKSTETEDNSGEDDDSLEKETPVKPILKIGEAFVHKQLSFLTNANDDYNNLQRISRFQHGFESSDEEVEDIKSLKVKCLSNLTSKRSESVNSDLSRKRSRESGDTDVDEDGKDDDDEFMPSFKKTSVVKSFKSFQAQQGVLIKDGKKLFSGVTISNSYKQVAGSKASISFLQRKKQGKQVKSLKERQIEQSINNSKLNSRLFSNSGFD